MQEPPKKIKLEDALWHGFEKEIGEFNKGLILYRKLYEDRYHLYIQDKDNHTLKWIGSYPISY